MASNNKESKKKNQQVKEGIIGTLGCCIKLLLSLVCLVISICFLLFIARLLFPKKVNLFNYHLSTRTFVELKAAHKYKAAADFYEQKREIFTQQGDKYINMTEVFDCYKRIGEYEKAEAILRDMDSLKYLSDKELKMLDKEPWYLGFFRFNIAKEYFNLYEEIGDVEGQKHYFEIMKECLSPDIKKNITEKLGEKSVWAVDNTLRLCELKMLYLSSPMKAIVGMNDYLDEITDSENHGPSYILKCANLLNNWIIEQRGSLPAYESICIAVDYALNTDVYNEDKSEYGTLSDICYKVHDIKNSKRFYSKYTTFLEESTSKDDPLYIENQIRGFRYLEDERNWAELETQIIECCTGLRTLLSKNIYTMSESQREHFVNLLNGPFDYAANLLYDHPSEKLASLCFENSIFMKGLLLRSSREIANKIKHSGDTSLVSMYNQLQEYRKELSYREGLGEIGNAIRIHQLRKDIDALDKQLAVSSKDYRIDQENNSASIRSISKSLTSVDAVIDYLQTDSGKLIALILTNSGKVVFVNLGSEEMVPIHPSARKTYSNKALTDFIWSPIEPHLNGVKNIYYSTTGLFNSISFQALALSTGEHLIDRYNFHLLSSISCLLSSQNDMLAQNRTNMAIWGDVDYGNKETAVPEDTIKRDVERGSHLRHLVYSKDEIDSIRQIVNACNANISFFAGTAATEHSFRLRSGMGDNILHISTHGFFDEDDAHRKDYNPMYNSGLFFAGADSTWNKVETVFVSESMEDDGILRANEIQYLDFSDCSLVVLSACKTGLGKNKSSEGVFGLQRAFKLSGVEKVLMSLWNVDDYWTSRLMQEFYRQYFIEGLSEEEALHAAQAALRREHPSPEYWGAFVLLN